MIKTKWDFSAGILEGLTPYQAGTPQYEASLDECDNMLIDFRGYVKERPAIKHVAWIDTYLTGADVFAMIPYAYQTAVGNVRGIIIILKTPTQWVAVWTNGSIVASTAPITGDVSVVGSVNQASGNAIVVLVAGTYSRITYNGTSVSVSAQAVVGGSPKRAMITYQGRSLAIAGDKTIIGSKIGLPYDFTTGTTAELGFSVDLDMQGIIKNLVPAPKGGVLVFCDDSQWLLMPGSSGILSASSIGAVKLSNYQLDGEARQAGADIFFMANSTISRYAFSNELASYRSARIAPTVRGRWLEAFEAGGVYYAAIINNDGQERTLTLLSLEEVPRAVHVSVGLSIAGLCAGDDGFYIATDFGIGFLKLWEYEARPLDWYQTIPGVTVGAGPTTVVVKHCSTTPSLYQADVAKLHVFYDTITQGLRRINHTWDEATKTLTYNRNDLVVDVGITTVTVFVGINYDMKVRTQRLELAGMQPDGKTVYTIGKKKASSGIMAITNAASMVLRLTSELSGDETLPKDFLPESLPPGRIGYVELRKQGQLDFDTKVELTFGSVGNANREVILYGMEITWDGGK